MELLHRRCCGLDVHKETVVACSVGEPTSSVGSLVGASQRLSHLLMTASSYLSSMRNLQNGAPIKPPLDHEMLPADWVVGQQATLERYDRRRAGPKAS
jgi:hypothetical protein